MTFMDTSLFLFLVRPSIILLVLKENNRQNHIHYNVFLNPPTYEVNIW